MGRRDDMAKIHLGIPWDANYVMHTLWQYTLKRSRFTDKLDTTFEDAPTETSCHERYLKSNNGDLICYPFWTQHSRLEEMKNFGKHKHWPHRDENEVRFHFVCHLKQWHKTEFIMLFSIWLVCQLYTKRAVIFVS